MPVLYDQSGQPVEVTADQMRAEVALPPEQRSLFFAQGQTVDVVDPTTGKAIGSVSGEEFEQRAHEFFAPVSAEESREARAAESAESAEAGLEALGRGAVRGIFAVPIAAAQLAGERVSGPTAAELAHPGLTATGQALGSFAGLSGVSAGAGLAGRAIGAGLARVGAGRGVSAIGSALATGAIEGGGFAAPAGVAEWYAHGGDPDRLADYVGSEVLRGAVLGAGVGAAVGAVGAGTGWGIRKIVGADGVKRLMERTAARQLARHSIGKTTAAEAQGVGGVAALERKILDTAEYTLDDGRKVFTGATQSRENLLSRIGQAERKAGRELGAIRKRIDGTLSEAGVAPDMVPLLQKINAVADELEKPGQLASYARAGKALRREFAPIQAQVDAGETVSWVDAFRRLRGVQRSIKSWTRKGTPRLSDVPQDAMIQAQAEFRAALDRQIQSVSPALAAEHATARSTYESIVGVSTLARKRVGADASRETVGVLEGISSSVSPLSATIGLATRPITARSHAIAASAALALARREDQIVAAAGRIAGGARRVARATTQVAVAFERSDRARRRATAESPEAVLARAHPGEAGGAPGLTVALLSHEHRRRGITASARPETARDPITGRPLGVPAPRDVARYSATLRAHRDPGSVIRRIGSGEATLDEVRALEQLSPRMFADLRDRVASKLLDRGADLDYDARNRVGITLGLPASNALASVGLIQSIVYAPPEQPSAAPPGSGAPIKTQTKTRAQQLEEPGAI